MENQLIEFLRDHHRNGWIEIGPYEIYLRHGFHHANGEKVNTLDIANINNKIESSRGKGGFSILLSIIHDLLQAHDEYRHNTQAIYVESVLNEQLGFHLLSKEGYSQLNTTPPSYIYYIPEPLSLADMNEMDAKFPGWDEVPTIEERFELLESLGNETHLS